MLGGGDTFVINGSFGTPKKSLALIIAKQKKIYLSLSYNGDNNYLFVNRKEIYKFKTIKMLTFQLSFV